MTERILDNPMRGKLTDRWGTKNYIGAPSGNMKELAEDLVFDYCEICGKRMSERSAGLICKPCRRERMDLMKSYGPSIKKVRDKLRNGWTWDEIRESTHLAEATILAIRNYLKENPE